MKKIICMILCLSMAFGLCACAGLDSIGGTQSQGGQTQGADATPEPPLDGEGYDNPLGNVQNAGRGEAYGAEIGDRVIIYTKKSQEDFTAPDGSIILLFSYVTPRLRFDERPEVEEKINEQLNLLEEAYISGSGDEAGRNHLLESATDNYNYIHDTGADLNTLFTSSRTVRGTRADGSVISFLFWTSVYTGGPRDRSGYFAVNFDSTTGDQLTLDSLSQDPEAFRETLTDCVIDAARNDIVLYSEMTQNDMDVESAVSAVVREGSWYFDTDGIVFFPAFGELRAEEKGLPMFTVPYSALTDVMDPRFFPVKRDGSGSLEIVRVGEVPDGTIANIDRILVSDGEELYLKANGTVYDLTISSAVYVDQAVGDEHFLETDRHWYASYMTDCALQICAVVPNGMPDMMISYTDQDFVQHRLFLSESGVNGGIALVDGTIEAVG